MQIVDYENLARELGVASNTQEMDIYPWVSFILIPDFHFVIIP